MPKRGGLDPARRAAWSASCPSRWSPTNGYPSPGRTRAGARRPRMPSTPCSTATSDERRAGGAASRGAARRARARGNAERKGGALPERAPPRARARRVARARARAREDCARARVCVCVCVCARARARARGALASARGRPPPLPSEPDGEGGDARGGLRPSPTRETHPRPAPARARARTGQSPGRRLSPPFTLLRAERPWPGRRAPLPVVDRAVAALGDVRAVAAGPESFPAGP